MGNEQSCTMECSPEKCADGLSRAASKAEPYTGPEAGDFFNRSLFDELGVVPLNRPEFATLREVWVKYDEGRNDMMTREECQAFLMFVSKVWGDGRYDPPPPSPDHRAAGAEAVPGAARDDDPVWSRIDREIPDEVLWEEIFAALWQSPVQGVPSHVVVQFQQLFQAALQECADGAGDADELATIDAVALANRVLRSVKAPTRAIRAALNAIIKSGVTIGFEKFLQVVGKHFQNAMPTHNRGQADLYSEGEMPADFGGTIYSFAPMRLPSPNNSYQILNCGEATLFQMYAAMRQAKVEICMSWWLFCPTLPILRGADVGNDAWKDAQGSLPQILEERAIAGVHVYILLYNIINVAPLVPIMDYATQFFHDLHDNIHVVRHPGMNMWSHTHNQKFVVVDRITAVVGGMDWAPGRWDTPAHPLFDPDGAVHPGIELTRNKLHVKNHVSDWWTCPENDIVANRDEVAAKKWQDVALSMVGGAAGDVALNFRQRWNWIIKERSDLIRDNYFRMVSIPDNIITSEFDQEVWKQKVSGGISLGEIKDQLTVGGYPSPNVSTSCRCQIVRSLGEWSGGLTFSESSYYEAWIEVINSAQNFIFMEQQYFISSTGESSARNKIAEAILKRVEVAIKEDRSFRIYIVVPIEVGAPATNYYTRKTLIQDAYTADANASFDQASFDDGTNLCLMSRIAGLLRRVDARSRWHGVSPESVLSVCTLASIGKSASGRWDVGHVFVHSKVLVVDDRVAILGSANLNDRSLVGYSDSELGAVLWDHDDDGGKVGAVKDLRLRLWRQYLGLAGDGSTDYMIGNPSSVSTFKLWQQTAVDNHTVLSSVFFFMPRDTITTMKEWTHLKKKYEKMAPNVKAASLVDPSRLNQVKGQLMYYPPLFLGHDKRRGAKEKLQTSLFSKFIYL